MLIKLLRRNRRVSGAARVVGFFIVLSALGFSSAVRSARAQVESRTQELGQKLLTELGPLVTSEPASVRINGQDLLLSSTVTPLSPKDVMGQIQSYCRAHSGGLDRAVGELPKVVKGETLSPELRDPSRWLTAESAGNDDYAQITCFARDDQSTLPDFVSRLEGFMTSGDLAVLGRFRYAVARRLESGKTHVLVIWADGHLNIQAMFPGTGDSPGSDATSAPRPPESSRLLSADISGHPYGLRLYETARAPEDVLAFYDRAMAERGYSAQALWLESESDERATDKPSYARAFAKNGSLTIVTALSEPVHGASTEVSVVDMGSRGEMAFTNPH